MNANVFGMGARGRWPGVLSGLLLVAAGLLAVSCTPGPEGGRIEADVVVVGGGASGVAAAIQAARMGMDVVVVESTDWLGGMLTAAGVSAVDGNHRLPSGLFGEFRERLYRHYGGPGAVATGWVSNTLFEPHVGNRILHEMVAEHPTIRVLKGHQLDSVHVQRGTVRWITARDSAGNAVRIDGSVFIEATEYGDLLAAAGAEYSHYMETFEQTGEPGAPLEPRPYVQDLTYVAILKEYGPGADRTVPRPDPYDTSDFTCMCRQVCPSQPEDVIDCQQMLNYGRLPNDKYMINWPNQGNDTYVDLLELDPAGRDSALVAAKIMTLSWVHFLQTEGGFTHLGLADDEFPTEDRLALIPYIRESRRVVGVDRLFLTDIVDPYADPSRPLYKTGIAVGDYPVDHHRKKNPVPDQIEFPPIPSYSVPFGALVPREVDALLVAEKSISVSNVANGTTRLQPVVLQIGQSAGAAAALAVQLGVEPREVPVRELQQALLEADMFLMPFLDVQPDSPFFEPVQRVGLSGVMRGTGVPFQWANQTWFYADSTLTAGEFEAIAARAGAPVGGSSGEAQPEAAHSPNNTLPLEMSTLVDWLGGAGSEQAATEAIEALRDADPSFGEDGAIRRRHLAFLLDRVLDPFGSDPVTIGFERTIRP